MGWSHTCNSDTATFVIYDVLSDYTDVHVTVLECISACLKMRESD